MSSTDQTMVIGPGLIIIATLCLGSVAMALILSRSDGAAKLAGIGIVPVAVIISLILWFAPQESIEGEAEVDVRVYDPSYYYRTFMLALMVITLVAALLLYALFEVLEPIYAKPLKKTSY